ncbi:MAG: hypothetical protein J7L45_00140 [Candidatus Aenigmarchaeota archaeon]|nr:hypothetical protein [Candidatus Aenigmarchaeota archaeon]
MKKAKELEEEIGVNLFLNGNELYVVATNEDKSIKYQELIGNVEESSLEYDPDNGEIIEVIDPMKPLRIIARSNERMKELVAYLRENGVDAYDVEERKMELRFVETIGRSKLKEKGFKNLVKGKDDEEIRKLAIKIGMKVIEQNKDKDIRCSK